MKNPDKKCDKAWFESMDKANQHAMKINKKKPMKNGTSVVLRPYQCEKCGRIHLTSWSKDKFKKNTPEIKKARRLDKFIRDEANYWSHKLGINKN